MSVELKISERVNDNRFDLKSINIIPDGDFGTFDTNVSGFSSDSTNGVSFVSNENAFLTYEVGTGFVLPFQKVPEKCTKGYAYVKVDEEDINCLLESPALVLEPNCTYYITTCVYRSHRTRLVANNYDSSQYFLNVNFTGFTDSNIITNVGNTGSSILQDWLFLYMCFTTGNDVNGTIKVEQTGSSAEFQIGEFFFDYLAITKDVFPSKADCYDNVNEKILPLKESLDAKVTFKIRDIKKPDFFFQRSATKDLDLVETKQTKECFGLPYDVSSSKGHRAMCKSYDAKLCCNNYEILSGVFSLKNAGWQGRNKRGNIRGNIIADNKDWIDKIEDKTFGDIDFSKYDHVKNFDNIEDTWSTNGSNGFYLYAPIQDIPNTDNVNVDGNLTIDIENMQPTIFLKPLLKEIFKCIKYDLEFCGEFLNSDCFCELSVYLNRMFTSYGNSTEFAFSLNNPSNTPVYFPRVIMNNHIAPYSIKEFLKSIFAMFNLIPITDNKTCKICLWTTEDFFYNSKKIDAYKFKLDCKTGFNVNKLNRGGGRCNFKYCEDGSDMWFQGGNNNDEHNELPFGDSFIQIDKTDKDKNVELLFAATQRWIVPNGMIIPRMDSEQEEFNPVIHPVWKPRIFKYNGLVDIPDGDKNDPNNGSHWFLNYDAGINGALGGISRIFACYPQLSMYDYTGLNEFNLAFHDIGDNEGLLNRFWKNDILAFENSMLGCGYFNLTKKDVKNIEWNKPWKVEGSYFLLNCIKDFDPFKNVPTKVELISYNQYFGDDRHFD